MKPEAPIRGVKVHCGSDYGLQKDPCTDALAPLIAALCLAMRDNSNPGAALVRTVVRTRPSISTGLRQ